MFPSVFLFILVWEQALTLKNLNYSIPEEQGPGTVFGNIGKDARLGPGERGKKSGFRVLENSAPHLIDVDPESGLLYTRQRIDRETLCGRNPECQLSIKVFGDGEEICAVKVEILDINDNSPSFPSDQIDVDVSESAAPGTRFPLTSAHDPDSGENGLAIYRISQNDHGIFSLDVKSRGNGTEFPELVIQNPLDREEHSHHTLILTATDGGERPRSGTTRINVTVIDSNDNSPVFEQPSYAVDILENYAPGEVLIDLNATDPDEGTNGQVIYSFSRHSSNRIRELFSIDPQTGVIKIQGEIYHEEIIEIDVQAEDLGLDPIPGHCKVTVTMADRNYQHPSIGVSVRHRLISEAVPPGTVIALVRVTDVDTGQNGSLQCRILGDVPFKLVENYYNSYSMVTDRPLDREAQDEYDVMIVAENGGISPLNTTVRVSVLDVNDNAPVIVQPVLRNGAAEVRVARNACVGHVVTTVRAVDDDEGEGGRLTYEIVNGKDGLFEVDSVTGEVRTIRPFWEEETPVVELVVTVIDHGEPPLSAVAKLIIRADMGPLPQGEPRIHAGPRQWDLPAIVTLSGIFVMLLAAMVTIAVKFKSLLLEINS